MSLMQEQESGCWWMFEGFCSQLWIFVWEEFKISTRHFVLTLCRDTWKVPLNSWNEVHAHANRFTYAQLNYKIIKYQLLIIEIMTLNQSDKDNVSACLCQSDSLFLLLSLFLMFCDLFLLFLFQTVGQRLFHCADWKPRQVLTITP